MFNRIELKTRAKEVLRVSYWRLFLASLILSFLSGGTSIGIQFPFSPSQRTQYFNFEQFRLHLDERVIPFLAVFLVIFFIIFLLFVAFGIFISTAFEVGCLRYFYRTSKGEGTMDDIIYAFTSGSYLKIVGAMLFRSLLLFLWSLLYIIPLIVLVFADSFILVPNILRVLLFMTSFLFIIPVFVMTYAYSMVPYILSENPDIGFKNAIELSKKLTDGYKGHLFVLHLSFIGWYALGLLACCVGILFVIPYAVAAYTQAYMFLKQNAIEKGICDEQSFIRPV